MSTFQFKSGVKTLDIKNAMGEVAKTFTVNVGEKEQTKKWMKQINNVKAISETLTDDETVIDQLEELEINVVKSILGTDAWDFLWDLCEHNVLSMLGFIMHLSKFLKESMNDFYKDYQ